MKEWMSNEDWWYDGIKMRENEKKEREKSRKMQNKGVWGKRFDLKGKEKWKENRKRKWKAGKEGDFKKKWKRETIKNR